MIGWYKNKYNYYYNFTHIDEDRVWYSHVRYDGGIPMEKEDWVCIDYFQDLVSCLPIYYEIY